MRQGTSTAPLSHKHSAHRRHGPQLSFPCTRETIYPHAPGAAFGNTLATTDNKSNDNTVAIPTYYTRYTMGPRVREDDEIKDGKKKPSEDQRQRTKNLNTTAIPPTVIPVHTGIHLSAHAGCRVWKYTRHNRQQEQRQYSSNTYHTMGPRVREDDEIRDKR